MPLGRRPKKVYKDIRANMVEWLEDHIGPTTEPFLSYSHLCEEDEFTLLRNAYVETVGDTWEHMETLYVIGATSGERWRLFQVSALPGSLFKHQFAVYIEDELLAIQFKLACT
jgi:hypothetical protein